MDSVIYLLIVIGLFALRSSKKKKQPPEKTVQRSLAEPENKQALFRASTKMPFLSMDWAELLDSTPESEKKEITVKPQKPVRTKTKQRAPKKAAVAPAGQIEISPPENAIHTEGESAEEHAAHIAKIRAEEEQLYKSRQELQELRHLNRQKLRSAVIMSEVLGKPVSLRSRADRRSIYF